MEKKKKVLFIQHNLLGPGGAQIFGRELVRRLSTQFNVAVFDLKYSTYRNVSTSAELGAQNYTASDFSSIGTLKMPFYLRELLTYYLSSRRINRAIRDDNPDIIIANKPPVFNLSRFRLKTTIALIQDADELSKIHYRGSLQRFYNVVFESILRAIYSKNLKRYDHIVTVSHYMKSLLREHKVDATVIYPVLDLKRPPPTSGEPEKKYISLVAANLQNHKGLDVFLSIAEQLPEESFLLCGRLHDGIQLPGNVYHQDFARDMTEIYRQTKLLICPSCMTWTEAFGRTPFEAGLHGVPSIIADRGGLPESAGAGGITIPYTRDPKTWAKEITTLLNDKPLYASLSQRAIEHSHALINNNRIEGFLDLFNGSSPDNNYPQTMTGKNL